MKVASRALNPSSFIRSLQRAWIALLTLLLFPASGFAQSPWERAAAKLEASFTGPLGRSLALVTIVIGGLMFMFADAIDFVLHLGRHDAAREVEQLLTIGGYDAARDAYDDVVPFDRARARSHTAAVLAGDHRAGLGRERCSLSSGTDVAAAL